MGWRRCQGLELLLLAVPLLLLLPPVRGGKDTELYCGVCRALVAEIDWAVKKVDPKKTIQVGSFRISPDGSQKPNEIPYARSETHLLELFETICSNMDDYALYEDPETQKKTYMRFAPRDSEKLGSVDFKNFKFDPEKSKSLKFVCESIVEEYEDEIISLFTHEADHAADKLCSEKSEMCDPPSQTPRSDL
ncbi:protein canopy-1 [Mustelus asterias]